VEDEIVRLLKTAARMHERERLKATRDTFHDTAAGFLAPPLYVIPSILTS